MTVQAPTLTGNFFFKFKIKTHSKSFTEWSQRWVWKTAGSANGKESVSPYKYQKSIIKRTFVGRYTKGVYAVSVAGRPPPNIIRDLKNRGYVYRSRDTSQR